MDIDASWQPSSPQRIRTGWCFGVLLGAAWASVIFIINLAALCAAASKNNSHDDQGPSVVTLFEGNCDRARTLNVVAHAIINILATVVLGASNYCMQCLSAPTREDVDRAHQSRRWVDIGMLSLRNLRRIPRSRVILWVLLGVSSLPLHLFYNSAVFISISATAYNAFFVSQALVAAPGNNDTFPPDLIHWQPYIEDLRSRAVSGSLDRLDALSCIDAYKSNIQSTRGAVLVVTDEVAQPVVLAQATNFLDSSFYMWVCGDSDSSHRKPCRFYIDEYRQNISSWAPFSVEGKAYTARYCYSEAVQQRCRLSTSLALGALVTVMTFIMAVVMLGLVFSLKPTPLLTIGDAVASFLAMPDPETRGMCMVSRLDVEKSRGVWPIVSKPFQPRLRRWAVAVGVRRWIVCMTFYLILGAIIAIFLHLGISHLGFTTSAADIITLGLGSLNPTTIIQDWSVPSFGSSAVVANVLVANVGQVVLSLIYFTYNGLFTAMFLSHQWSTYGRQRKGLRVSWKPEGDQRGSYFLQLPYRIALPLMAGGVLFHWLLSQAIYLVDVQAYAVDALAPRTDFSLWRRDPGSDVTSCAYSPLAMILMLVVGMVLLLFLGGMSARRLASTMPIVGSCSAAISAACHVSGGGGENAAGAKVRWGADGWRGSGVGHCSFASDVVYTPEEGRWYA
ncbi:hypothetical protein FALCPG4_015608 [Fusarium falciforme]